MIETRLKSVAHVFVQMGLLIIPALNRLTIQPQAMLCLPSVAALGLPCGLGCDMQVRHVRGRNREGVLFPCAYSPARGRKEDLS